MRFEMVFTFNCSTWVLKPELNQIFRLGDSFYRATLIVGDLVLAAPYHHYCCSAILHDEWIPIEQYRELFS